MTRVVNLRKEPYDVYIGRKSGNKHFGNPFTHLPSTAIAHTKDIVHVPTREEAVNSYEAWLKGTAYTDLAQERRQWILDNLGLLKDKVLGCYCYPLRCHGHVLAELVDATN